MKKFATQSILLIIITALALVFFGPTSKSTKLELPFLPKPAVFKQLQINDNRLKVEIADTPQKRSKGLGGRVSIASDEGMLFIFDKADKYSFWMKGVKFPLDFVYLRDGKVTEILSDIKPPLEGQKDESLPIYQPKEPVDMVLEVNAGTAQRLTIKAGDTIKLLP